MWDIIYYIEKTFGKAKYLIVALVFLQVSAKAQEPANENGILLNAWTSSTKNNNHFSAIELAHEWKSWTYLGFELGAGLGWLACYDLQKSWVNPVGCEKLYLREISGGNEFIRGKLTAYLPLWRDDDMHPRLVLFVSGLGGFTSALNIEGHLEYFETGEKIETSSQSGAHWFSGFEMGLKGSFSRHFAMKLYLGNNNIQFSETIKEMNTMINNFPIRFDEYVSSAYVGISLVYTYSK
ncbi:hypothetical protein [uncultured Draconibacterium sp.]|uniref:hypothetical protein n=1 Tax=uncultured Draconibacterium sp. TaxID=1573823 RepID=UPI003261C109